MYHLQCLHDTYLQRQSPAQEITAFLFTHSNSTEYLISNLEAILVAIKADAEDEVKIRNSIIRGLRKEKAEKEPDTYCTVCLDRLEVEDGKPKRIRGACPKCHKKVNRLIVAGEITDEDATNRGWFLPALKGGRPFAPGSPGALLKNERKAK